MGILPPRPQRLRMAACPSRESVAEDVFATVQHPKDPNRGAGGLRPGEESVRDPLDRIGPAQHQGPDRPSWPMEGYWR